MSSPIEHDHVRRLGALRERLAANGLAAAILSRPEHVFYFTGLLPGSHPALLAVLPQTEIALAPRPARGIETIVYTSYDISRGWDINKGVAGALAGALSGRGLGSRSVGLELDHLPASQLAVIAAEVGESRDIGALLWRLRRVKDDAEIAQIQANVAGNDRLFETVREVLRPGVSEVELWSAMFRTRCEITGGPALLAGDLGGGIRSRNPDASPTLERLHPGEQLLVDIYPGTSGYYADTTRSFVLGEPSVLQGKIHTILEQALAAGESTLLPGTRACEVDAVVRGTIEAAGYGPNFPHHSGHAFGLFPQELPFLIPAETTTLESGMTVTLEPGIYIDGWGGMRLEGNYLVADTGPRRLDHFPSKLTVC